MLLRGRVWSSKGAVDLGLSPGGVYRGPMQHSVTSPWRSRYIVAFMSTSSLYQTESIWNDDLDAYNDLRDFYGKPLWGGLIMHVAWTPPLSDPDIAPFGNVPDEIHIKATTTVPTLEECQQGFRDSYLAYGDPDWPYPTEIYLWAQSLGPSSFWDQVLAVRSQFRDWLVAGADNPELNLQVQTVSPSMLVSGAWLPYFHARGASLFFQQQPAFGTVS